MNIKNNYITEINVAFISKVINYMDISDNFISSINAKIEASYLDLSYNNLTSFSNIYGTTVKLNNNN